MPSKKGERKRRPLNWNDERICKVFAMVLEGRYPREKIAKDCDVPPRTYDDWIAHPEFQAALAEKRTAILAASEEVGVAYVTKLQRIMGLSQMAESARVEYEARPWLQEKRQIGFDKDEGKPLYLVNESYNKDAHSAFREALNDIAKEFGHRKTVTEVTGKDGAPLIPENDPVLGAMTDEEFAQVKAIRAAAQARLEHHETST